MFCSLNIRYISILLLYPPLSFPNISTAAMLKASNKKRKEKDLLQTNFSSRPLNLTL